jgi:hypothetical protein
MIAHLRKLEDQWRALATEKAAKARSDVSAKYADELLAEAAAFCECADEIRRVLERHAPSLTITAEQAQRKLDVVLRVRDELEASEAVK